MTYQMGDNEKALSGSPANGSQMGWREDDLEKAFADSNITRLQQGTNEALWGEQADKKDRRREVKTRVRQMGEGEHEEQKGISSEPAVAVQMG
ncbi:MAG: hypothetical protein H6858_02260 [Rhodospirillales bacterium]|nr:hypothetical protein [Alphaproteobacteria bacterium]MCB1841294.1 hypothetical protein [Alphaproteobacteria bacterium]MCB9976407.1 hypothetical protein [Rhodospirillales bacterium]